MSAATARTPSQPPPNGREEHAQFGGGARITGLSPRVMMDGQQTIMRLCATCQQQMPHKVGARCCILCELDETPTQPPPNSANSGEG